MTALAALRSTAARAIVTVAVLGVLVWRIDLEAAAGVMLTLDLRHAAAVLALLALDRFVMIVRWALLLRASGTAIVFKSAAWIYLVSSFVGSFLPASVGADAMRAYTLGQRTAAHGEAIASVAVDRLLGLLSLLVLGLIGVFIWARVESPGLQQGVALVSMLAAAGAGGLFWSDAALRAVLPDRWQRTPSGSRLMRLADALGRYRTRRAALSAVLALSFAVQLLRIAQAWLLGMGIGITVGFASYLVFMPIGLIMLLLPVSISGFGLPQGVIVWMLAQRGVPGELSFALSTLIVLSGIVGNLPGAWLYLRQRTG